MHPCGFLSCTIFAGADWSGHCLNGCCHVWDVIVKSTLKMILEIACAPEVLCMLWNEDLAWHQAEFQFVEIFSGRANVSREWSPPHWVCFMWAMIC